MSFHELQIQTSGEGLYSLGESLSEAFGDLDKNSDGLIHLFILHTSCALTINESFDPSAKADLENFFKHLAPRNLPFITHTAEGPDDSPSHMKSSLLQQSLVLPFESGKISLGTWQGVYLAEFRDQAQVRKVKWAFQKL